MTSISVSPLADDVPFGAKVTGVNWQSLNDESVRKQIQELFEEHGVIVFKDVERSSQMHLALSEVLGPLQAHPLKERPGLENAAAKGDVTNFNYKGDLVDAEGRLLTGWIPWHFDSCYMAKLNRGAVLRAIEIPPEGGMTGFADGIQLYQAISPQLRAKFEDLRIIYHLSLVYMNQRFGVPKNYRWISLSENASRLIEMPDVLRSIHPAIWRRKSGESVLHVSPWQAVGIKGHEDPEGDALLEALSQEIYAKMKPYWHRWELADMVLWDNWRCIHSASGNDPKYVRQLQRTTIEGDYGLGSFEHGAAANEPPEISI